MQGIWKNKDDVQISAFRLGYDTKLYWFEKLQNFGKAKTKYTKEGYNIYLFGKWHLVDCPYIFKDNNKIVVMNSGLFYDTFEFVRPYNSKDLHRDSNLIDKLLEEGIIDNYFEVIEV